MVNPNDICCRWTLILGDRHSGDSHARRTQVQILSFVQSWQEHQSCNATESAVTDQNTLVQTEDKVLVLWLWSRLKYLQYSSLNLSFWAMGCGMPFVYFNLWPLSTVPTKLPCDFKFWALFGDNIKTFIPKFPWDSSQIVRDMDLYSRKFTQEYEREASQPLLAAPPEAFMVSIRSTEKPGKTKIENLPAKFQICRRTSKEAVV